jgi:phage terminase large subunit GpA-like protein
VHFPELGEDFFRGITAEQLLPHKTAKGYLRLEWTQIPGRRNDELDAWVYARGGASVLGLDRFQEKDWAALEIAIGHVPTPPKPKADAVVTVQTPAPAPAAPPRRSAPWLPRRQRWLGGGR